MIENPFSQLEPLTKLEMNVMALYNAIREMEEVEDFITYIPEKNGTKNTSKLNKTLNKNSCLNRQLH